jgi:SET domain-containing protein
MLYIKTIIKPSKIQGLGLFTLEPIIKGTLIFRWDDRFGLKYTDEEKLALPQLAQDFIWRYGWHDRNSIWLVDLDDSRFINHSNKPNMFVTCESNITSIAARDIEAGEELTENYESFDPDFEKYGKGWR